MDIITIEIRNDYQISYTENTASVIFKGNNAGTASVPRDHSVEVMGVFKVNTSPNWQYPKSFPLVAAELYPTQLGLRCTVSKQLDSTGSMDQEWNFTRAVLLACARYRQASTWISAGELPELLINECCAAKNIKQKHAVISKWFYGNHSFTGAPFRLQDGSKWVDLWERMMLPMNRLPVVPKYAAQLLEI